MELPSTVTAEVYMLVSLMKLTAKKLNYTFRSAMGRQWDRCIFLPSERNPFRYHCQCTPTHELGCCHGEVAGN